MKNFKIIKNSNPLKNEVKLMRFLKLTKSGKYAPIEKSSLKYARVQEETSEVNAEDTLYYYSLS